MCGAGAKRVQAPARRRGLPAIHELPEIPGLIADEDGIPVLVDEDAVWELEAAGWVQARQLTEYSFRARGALEAFQLIYAVHEDGLRTFMRAGPGGTEAHCRFAPAVTQANGMTEWFLYGRHHREDGPAVESPDGSELWMQHGMLHRIGGPAYCEPESGETQWHFQGQPHRLDGPAVENANGFFEWCRKGKYHREGGPAVRSVDGQEEWYRNGRRHREDGPAVERADGSQEWWLNDQQVSEEVWKRRSAFRSRRRAPAGSAASVAQAMRRR